MKKLLSIFLMASAVINPIFGQEKTSDFPLSLQVEKHPKHLAWIVERPYSLTPNNYNQNFSFKLGKVLYGLFEDERILRQKEIKKKSREIFLNLFDEQGTRIPHISHRIWVTSTKNPREASAERVNLYLQSLKKLPTDWKHNFWCIDPTQIPETIKILQSSEIPIKIRKLDEISETMKGKHVVEAYCDDNQFCLASDIIRHNIIYQFGGVYSDLGTNIVEDLTPYVNAYDFMFSDYDAYIDHSFFAYRKQEPVIKEFLDILDDLYNLPKPVKTTTQNPRDNVVWHSTILFTLIIDKFCKSEDRLLYVPEGKNSLMWINHSGSWLGRDDLSGNQMVHQSALDILSVRPISVDGLKSTLSTKSQYKIEGQSFFREDPKDWSDEERNTLIAWLHKKEPYYSIAHLQDLQNTILYELLLKDSGNEVIKLPLGWSEDERNTFIVNLNQRHPYYSLSSLQARNNISLFKILTGLWSEDERNTFIAYLSRECPHYSLLFLQSLRNMDLTTLYHS